MKNTNVSGSLCKSGTLQYRSTILLEIRQNRRPLRQFFLELETIKASEDARRQLRNHQVQKKNVLFCSLRFIVWKCREALVRLKKPKILILRLKKQFYDTSFQYCIGTF